MFGVKCSGLEAGPGHGPDYYHHKIDQKPFWGFFELRAV